CGFGSTETGVARHFFIDRDTPIEGEAIPLGYPVEDLEVSLLDEQDRPVAPGEVGEMVIRSRYISRGYWNRPDLNERLFG
ncbi:AMP-binding protein, partial [Acinetobacter baumannii]